MLNPGTHKVSSYRQFLEKWVKAEIADGVLRTGSATRS